MIAISRLHEIFRLDSSTGRLYWRISLSGRGKVGAEAGFETFEGYRHVGFDRRHMPGHRVVFAMTHGRWPTKALDHINGQRDDNRPENLREATTTENNRNCKMPRTNTSGIKGVCRFRGKWRAQIRNGGEGKIFLGDFERIEDAAAAYREAAERLHGEFSRVA